MPWRTILEFSKILLHQSHQAYIINGSDNRNLSNYSYEGVDIVNIPLGMDMLRNYIERHYINVLLFQVTWRDGLKDFSYLCSLNCRKIAYFSGGVYNLKNALYLLFKSSYSAAKPYLIESIVPKSFIRKKLSQARTNAVIGLTPFTTRVCKQNGISKAYTILPGQDIFSKLDCSEEVLYKYKLKGQKYLCFTGSDAPTRGLPLLLETLAEITLPKDITIVLLIRKDANQKSNNFKSVFHQAMQKNNIVIVEERLSKGELKAFFKNAYYMILPFIVIPSEIPLTYLEILSCGTPIISFSNGGTTKLLEKALLISPLSSLGLGKTLFKAVNDDKLRETKSIEAIKLMHSYPTWDESSKELNKIIFDE